MIVAWILMLSIRESFAGSATWSILATGDWNVSDNWNPATIPNGPSDTATFAGSFGHATSFSASTEVNSIVFASTATVPYTITASPAIVFTISGTGVVNNSGTSENFVASASGAFGGLIRFTNSASAGDSTQTIFTSNGGDTSGFAGGTTQFNDTSTAGSAVFNANAGQRSSRRHY